jgi:hypothetical protein
MPFPSAFAMVLKVHIDGQRAKGTVHLFGRPANARTATAASA